MNASPNALSDTFLHEAAQDVMAVVFLIVLALRVYAIRTGHIATHRAWMMRAYAITLGAATQTVMLERVAFHWIQTFTLQPEAAFAVANAFGLQREFD